jgi:VCBS repeat protein/IPT/TIG domain-containing protein
MLGVTLFPIPAGVALILPEAGGKRDPVGNTTPAGRRGGAMTAFLSKFGGPILSVTTLLFPPASAFAACPDFRLARPVSGPYSWGYGATADFDGDGRSDLALVAVSASASNFVSIVRGNADGTFTLTGTPAVVKPSYVVASDFNGDGKSDLAVLSAPNAVAVLLNDGHGAFGPANTYDIGAATQRLVAVDLNGDGKPDLAVATSTSVTTLLNNGNGTFAVPVSNPSGVGWLGQGDFNRDGRKDIVRGRSILFGNGNGTLSAPTNLPPGPGDWMSTVGAADLNGDGNSDLILGGWGVGVLLGKGDGTFAELVGYQAGPGNYPMSEVYALGDVNGDSKTDVVVKSVLSGDLSILIGNGDGTFQPETRYLVGGPVPVLIGDFNGDGYGDIFSALWVLFGRSDGTFFGALSLWLGGGHAGSITTGDFNADGNRDLVVAVSYDMEAGDGRNFSVLLGNGDGTFRPRVTYPSTLLDLTDLAAGDFNGDGRTDLAVSGMGGVAIYLSNPDGTLSGPRYFDTNDDYGRLVAADFNGDNRLDLAKASESSDEIAILLGDGNGNFTHATPFKLTSGAGFKAWSVASSDFNHDGRVDLAVANANTGGAAFSIFLGNGDGTFAPPVAYVVAGVSRTVIADLNGDGNVDLIFPSSDGIGIRAGRGDGTFDPPVNRSTSLTSPSPAAVADFNGDGINDLALSSWEGLSILRGYGDGTFGPSITFAFGIAGIVSDFNGDGRPDFAGSMANDHSFDYATAAVMLNESLCSALTSITPNGGPTTGGGTAVITGSSLAGATQVMFGATTATITANTPTTISVTVPAHAEGAIDVTVRTAGGPATLVNGYEYAGAPTLLSLSSNTGPTTGGIVVTINGTNLGIATSVTFGGVPAMIKTRASQSLSVIVPTHGLGRVDVVVASPSGSATLPNAFEFIEPIPTLAGWFMIVLGGTVMAVAMIRLRS